MAYTEILVLLTILDQAFDRKSWHGTNLRGSIRGLSREQAAWRPSPARHSIWEIVIHAAYWKYIVQRRLLAEDKGSFPLKGSNWIPRAIDVDDEATWKSDVKLLCDMHTKLRAAVVALRRSDLTYCPAGSKVRNFELITGIAAHDLYHAGQIQLLKRLRTGGQVPVKLRRE